MLFSEYICLMDSERRRRKISGVVTASLHDHRDGGAHCAPKKFVTLLLYAIIYNTGIELVV